MRFLVLVAALGLLVASLYLVVVFGRTPYAEVQRLGHVAYYEYAPDGPSYLKLALTPARYLFFQLSCWALLGMSLLVSAALLRMPAWRRLLKRLTQEAFLALAALKRTYLHLTSAQRAVALTLLLLILAAQLVWLLNDPLSPDEIGSYDAFVHEGPAAIASFYPIPNNHVGYNLLSWLLAQALPGEVRLVMRLPSLLLATVGTGFGYLMLVRLTNFRVATLATALFGLTKLTVIYATAGRGYYLQLVCIQLAFYSTLQLLCHHRYRRLAWATFVGAGVLGLYAIPTYGLPLGTFAGIFFVCSWKFPARKRHVLWANTALAMAIIACVAAVIYLPIGCVSGWKQLLGNRYLATHSLADFWSQGRAHLYETTGMLLGPVRPALLSAAVLLGVTPLLLRRQHLPVLSQRLGWMCWALLLSPLVFMLARQVFIPARVLLYTTYFLYMLAALAADYSAQRRSKKPLAHLPLVLLAALPLYRSIEFAAELPALFQSRDRAAGVSRAYQWLRRQPRGPVFIRAPYHALMFHHFALLDGWPLALDAQRTSGVQYPYYVRVADKSTPPTWISAQPYRAVYRDDQIIIYALQTFPTPH